MYTKGFTLIELLMVVAIIGLIALVTFSYLGESRDKGADGATQQNMVNARSQAEVYFTNNETYEGVCNDTTLGIFNHIQAATQAQNITPLATYTDETAGTATQETCHDSPLAYAVWVPLKQGGGICIDSDNTTIITTTPLPSTPANARFTCPS